MQPPPEVFSGASFLPLCEKKASSPLSLRSTTPSQRKKARQSREPLAKGAAAPRNLPSPQAFPPPALPPARSEYPPVTEENLPNRRFGGGRTRLRIVYHCRDGFFDSPLAAAIHLGLLSDKEPPGPGELRAFPHYGRVDRTPGRLYLAGADEAGNRVYTLGRLNAADFVIKVLDGANSILFGETEGLTFFDCEMPGALGRPLLKLLCRREPSGINLAIAHSIKTFPRIAEIVRRAKIAVGMA